MGRTVESPVKTRTSRRRIDLDARTLAILEQWRQRLVSEGGTIEPSTPMFLNTHHRTPSPESFSQLFAQTTTTTGLTRIRFHGLRHTHASLLVAAGVPIKVVSERLGQAHPGFTMHTYQHLLPGMGAAAATQFAPLISQQPLASNSIASANPSSNRRRRSVHPNRSTTSSHDATYSPGSSRPLSGSNAGSAPQHYHCAEGQSRGARSRRRSASRRPQRRS